MEKLQPKKDSVEKLKTFMESVDLLLKIVIAVLAFFIFQVEQNRLDLETKEIENRGKQQASNLVVAEKIISLLYEEKNKCIAEDQAFMIDFLIDNNNAYNQILINKEDFYRASAARRNCLTGSIAQDAETSTSLTDDGQLPVLTTEDISTTTEELATKGVTVVAASGADIAPSGYVAVGAFSLNDTTFRNFEVEHDAIDQKGSIAQKTIIRPRWSVYLRANKTNTEHGANPILGVVDENSCVEVLESYPKVRGQTWAAVKLVECPDTN